MTAQPNNHEDHHPAEDQTDPIGPITLPKRWFGGRALALVGSASVLAVGIVQFAEASNTVGTSVSAPH
jgi:hypothetical protein